ncbi:oxidoreductase [Aspergillus heteromorphus CBS 117.55]|uniref:Oxidoreductase n=1 Tax=Aspergillus heteromorphus CBS 117.55 TaxID=1448321 RepID=A0A317V713_9EURO|nr:oxidoreductase [Aspergillus heteromorphus CBS 117.55]PWY69051.1 oxidoreductase [Aspergillus heteromorphus CBS 117.55]
MPDNRAAWLVGPRAHRLEVLSAPYTHPQEGQIVIRNRAVAINPIDWVLQGQGTTLMYRWLPYPCVLGSDVAGEVVEVGPGVTRYQVGDRVLGKACGTHEKINSPTQGGFQTYVVLADHMTSRIPDSLPYERAVVLPLGIATAACGLFEPDQLNLRRPQPNQPPTGKTVIIWGGSTSVGSNAIQLATAAGYEVFTTASPRNFDYVKSLGAVQAFDYRSRTVVSDMLAACQGKTLAGALTVGANAAGYCMDILGSCTGDRRISMATYPVPSPPPKVLTTLRTMLAFMGGNVSYWVKSRAKGIQYNYIFASTLYDNGIGQMIFADYLPRALAEGRYQVVPEAVVYANGLDHIQDAMDYHKQGLSARKVVVSLND